MSNWLPAAHVCRRRSFLCLSKETNQRKDTTPKNSQILLSHNLTHSRGLQNLEFTQGVDYPPHSMRAKKGRLNFVL